MSLHRFLSVLALLMALSNAAGFSHAQGAESYGARADVKRFIAEMSEKHGFRGEELETLFARVRRQASVLRAMQAPAESPRRSWKSYRSIFMVPARIEGGRRFREQHAAALARAASTYGVPEEIIVAIIGVETVYGRNTGSFRVVEALATLAFDFPARAEYFRSELEQFLLQAREEGIDPLAMRGSYAGAMGIPQFMPGSWRRFAVDFDGDGRRDLAGSPVDAIGSVANFLREHGWIAGQPIAARASVTGEAFKPIADAGIKPAYRVRDLAAVGVTASEPAPADALSALIELPTPGEPSEFWLGFDNFFALTRYNRSSFYAISVLELSRAVARHAGTAVSDNTSSD